MAAAAVFTVIGVIVGLALSSHLDLQTNGYGAAEPPARAISPGAPGAEVSAESIGILRAYSDAMVEMVKTVGPVVVNISTSKTVRGGRGRVPMNPFLDDPFFRRFFGDEFEHPRERDRKVSNLGSGIVVDSGGHILTNSHVVSEADEITVTLSDNREFKGTVVGIDRKTDLAVVKIDATGLPSARLGDSGALQVGELVIAVGSPYGLNQTVTSGIVSATGRSNVRINDYEDFIQTDAAINPGNSGGPLLNLRGEVVGINSAIFSTSGGYQGIGFAIPIDMAKVVMEGLITKGRVVRGWLGVSIQPLTKELAAKFGIKGEKGALISDIVSGSPAEKAGLKRGDIIISYNEKEIADIADLRNTVAASAPGTRARVAIVRDGEPLAKNVTIGELPASEDEEAAASGGGEPEYDNVLSGVHVQDLTDDIRRQLRISGRVKGVVVAFVEDDIGLERGDVIVEVNREPVPDVATYEQAASRIAKDEGALLLVFRKGGVFYLPLDAGQ
jgi:serine protease Do